MNLFAITSLLVSLCCLGLSIFIFLIAKTKIHKIWALFNLTCFIWAIGTFFAAISKTPYYAELSWRWAYGPGAIVPCTFYYFIHSYCELKQRNTLYFLFAVGVIIGIFNFVSPYFVDEVILAFNSIYYNKASPLLSILMIYLTFTVILSLIELFKFYKTCIGNKRTQALYSLYSFGIGWSGGFVTFLPSYEIFIIYPAWNILVCVYVLLMTYAILKHQLMDIRIVIQQGIVYSISIAILSLLYLILIFILEKSAQVIFSYQSLAISIGTAFAIGLLFVPLHQKIQYFMEKYFFKGSTVEIAEQNILLRKEVTQSEKHKAVANLASGIAHEVKNPLTALKAFHEYFPEKKNDPEFLEKFNHIVGKELGRIESLVEELLDFAKPSPACFQRADIHKLIDDTLSLLGSKFVQNNITVRKYLVSSIKHLDIDPSKIKQALLNIFLNAIDAMPDGGELTVSSFDHRTSYFEITIEDTGSGIPKENLKHIFDPFYTQKETGTGLGLAITQGIIHEHGGKIHMENINIGGAKASIALPYK